MLDVLARDRVGAIVLGPSGTFVIVARAAGTGTTGTSTPVGVAASLAAGAAS